MSNEFKNPNGTDNKVEPKNTSEQTELERLKKMRYEAENRKDWVDSFKDGETRRYRFVYDGRTGYRLKHYKFDDQKKPLDQGIMKYHFYVFNLDDPEQLRYGKDQEFLLVKTHSKNILDCFIQGHYDLKITRHGKGPFDTRYEVEPIVTTPATAA